MGVKGKNLFHYEGGLRGGGKRNIPLPGQIKGTRRESNPHTSLFMNKKKLCGATITLNKEFIFIFKIR